MVLLNRFACAVWLCSLWWIALWHTEVLFELRKWWLIEWAYLQSLRGVGCVPHKFFTSKRNVDERVRSCVLDVKVVVDTIWVTSSWNPINIIIRICFQIINQIKLGLDLTWCVFDPNMDDPRLASVNPYRSCSPDWCLNRLTCFDQTNTKSNSCLLNVRYYKTLSVTSSVYDCL